MSSPTDGLREALALNIRRIITGELEDVSDARFAELAAMYRATREHPAIRWLGEIVLVTPVRSGWQTIGKLVAIHEKTIELDDASPARYPNVNWGRQLIPIASIASIAIPSDTTTEGA